MNIIHIICYIILVAALIVFISYLLYLIFYDEQPLFISKLKPGDKLFIWNSELQAFNIIEITSVTEYSFSGKDTVNYDNIISGFNYPSRCMYLTHHNYNKLVSDYYKYDGEEYHILITKNEKKFYKYLKKYV